MKQRTYSEVELFSVTCGARTWEPVPAELRAAYQAHLGSPIPYGRPEAVEAWRAERDRLEATVAPWSDFNRDTEQHGRWAGCAFTTNDREAWTKHSADVHGGKMGSWRDPDKKGKYNRLSPEPLLGNGFRWRPVVTFERERLGHTVEIIQHADTSVHAQIVSLADKSLVGGGKATVFAVDESGQFWIFDSAPRSGRPTAWRISPDGRVIDFQQGHGHGYVELKPAAVAS